jgi:hypothetical protein
MKARPTFNHLAARLHYENEVPLEYEYDRTNSGWHKLERGTSVNAGMRFRFAEGVHIAWRANPSALVVVPVPIIEPFPLEHAGDEPIGGYGGMAGTPWHDLFPSKVAATFALGSYAMKEIEKLTKRIAELKAFVEKVHLG